MTDRIITYQCNEGGYVVEIPELKGCLAQGETLEQALAELKVVADLWLATAEKYGQKLPDLANRLDIESKLTKLEM